jgi:TrmH family RNA methyltransferase
MTMIHSITSKDNPQYRYVRSLHDRKTAEIEGIVYVEGVRLCEEAFLSGINPMIILFSDEKITLATDWCERFSIGEDVRMYSMPSMLFDRLGSTKHPQGVAMVIKSPLLRDEIPVRGDDMYMVCEGVADPGNLGSIIRSADAFDFTAVVLCRGCVDPFNEKVLRSSMGSCFHIPIVFYDSIEEICFQFKKMGVQLIASHLDGTLLTGMDFTPPSAVFIGNEARGLSKTCTDLSDFLVKIPMPGQAESLNAAAAASILGYTLSCSKNLGIPSDLSKG